MNPLHMLTLCLLVVLTGCAKSTTSTPCASPVDLPNGAMNDRDVELYWGADRAALVECGRFNGVVQ